MTRRLTPWVTAAFLVALTVLAHFALAGHFGFYEDDYAFAAPTLDWTPAKAMAWARVAVGPDGQGRPLGFLLGAGLPWVGYHLTRSVAGMYAVAAAVLSANVLLFHGLLRRAAFPAPVPLLAAVAFALYPADTTRPFLCHALILQPSLTFLLVALHLYLGGRRQRPWAYVAIVGSLLCYETAVLPFVAAPLLVPAVWNRRLPGRFARHLGVLLAMGAVTFLVRRLTGEFRAAQTIGTVDHLTWKVVSGCAIGPAVAVRQCLVRPLNGVNWPAIAATLPLAAAVMLAGRRSALAVTPLVRAVGVGGVLAVLAYGLSFTHYPPTQTAGRLTSVHVAAAPGVALLVAAAVYAVLLVGRRTLLFYPAAFLVGLYLAALFGFAWSVQRGFARQWQEQRTYWTRIVRLCPDATAGTVVLLRGPYPPESDVALTKTWADFRVWAELFTLPKSDGPTFVDFDDWPHCLAWRDGAFRWSRVPHPGYGLTDGQPLPAGHVILLQAGDYQIVRVGGAIDVDGHPLPLRPLAGDGLAGYPRRPLYRLLIRE